MSDTTQNVHALSDHVLSDDDRLIADSAERLFAQQVDKAVRQRTEAGEWPAALWAAVTDIGLPMLLAAEAQGGFGGRWSAAYAVLRGLGHWQVPLPLAETMVAAQLLSAAGLPVPQGPLTLIEAARCPGLQVGGTAAQPVLTGTAHRVPWARHAVAAAVALPGGIIALVPLRSAAGAAGATGAAGAAVAAGSVARGLDIRLQTNHAGLPSDTVVFDRAEAQAAGPHGLGLAEPAWTLGALARCVMMVGALESALAQSVQYAGERVQFGKPIGRNQAIQQALALMAGDVVAARMAALAAVADAPTVAGAVNTAHAGACAAAPMSTSTVARSPACLFSVAVAKVRCGEAATRATNTAHQVHGAIGFTHEHALHFATRRLWAWREEFGSDADWARDLGRAAIRGRAPGFWPGLTARSLMA